MKLFNSQNCLSGKKYKTVWLNIDDRNCSSVSFWYDDSENHDSIQVTAKDFAKARERKLNFAYAGGINQANYTESVSKQGTYYIFTYQLNKIRVNHEIFGSHTMYDYAKAIFKNGAPVDTFSITIDVSTGAVINTNFFTAVNNGYSALLDAASAQNNDTDPIVIYPPVIRAQTSWESKEMTAELAINMQTRLNSEYVPGHATRRHVNRHHIDGGEEPETIYTQIVAWFIQFRANYLTIYVVYDDSPRHFQFAAEDPVPWLHTVYLWYNDQPSSPRESTISHYQNTIDYDQ